MNALNKSNIIEPNELLGYCKVNRVAKWLSVAVFVACMNILLYGYTMLVGDYYNSIALTGVMTQSQAGNILVDVSFMIMISKYLTTGIATAIINTYKI